MTTSGSAAFNPAVTLIVAQALRQLGIIMEDEDPTGAMYSTGVFQMNALVASAQATGAHVWTEEEAILFIEPGVPKYIIGGPTLALNAHTADADEWLQLSLAANASPGDWTVQLSDVTGVLEGDNIGIVLNDGSVFWTIANGQPLLDSQGNPITDANGNIITAGVFGAGDIVGVAAQIPASGATAGAYVFTYTTPIVRPLKVPNARLLYLNQNSPPNNPNENPMTILSRQEYMDLPNKRSQGVPTQWFYSPQRDQGLFYIWPVPVTTAWAIRFTWYRPLQDFFAPGNTMDFPQEWVNPLLWGLARDLMGIYDTPPQRQAYINAQAAQYADLTVSYDRESEPVQFGLSWESVNNS